MSAEERPVILGVVGDSASGKTTLSKGLVQLLGADTVTHVCTDDYHRYDRAKRAELGITPLNPDCNYIDIMAQHLSLLRDGAPILKPIYGHSGGTFGPPEYIVPGRFMVIEGLLGYHNEEMRAAYDVRVYLDPPEDLRREWKIQRDCSKRGYAEEDVLAELERREPDSVSFIRPQERWADLVVRQFVSPETGDPTQLDAELTLRDGLPHPDLGVFTDHADSGIKLTEVRDGERLLCIPGSLDRARALEIEEAIWDAMHFASHLRSERLGELTIDGETRHSESLGLIQLLILYHLTTAVATVALGAEDNRL
ncbi:MAG TPA: phosphoribulokinase [Solirubrobacteraceae bacterium]|jgi:phosphoribulokinase|nr:phosphoribulokinase [Solirubrobacteraceae bacterium]